MDKAPIAVCAAVMRKGDEVLLTKRSADCDSAPKKWEFPGGKIEFGESPERCLEREIKEELGIEIRAGKLLTVTSHVYGKGRKGKHVVIIAYEAGIMSGSPGPAGSSGWGWHPIRALGALDICEADKPIASLLIGREGRG